MSFGRIQVSQTAEAHAAFQNADGPRRISTDIEAELFGERLHCGTLVGDIYDWVVVESEVDPSTGRVEVVIEPTSDAARNPTFRLAPTHGGSTEES